MRDPVISVAVLVVTGLYAGLLYVPNWAALLDTPSGAALSGKLLVVVPLLALGAINLLVMHSHFRRARRDRPDPAQGSRRRQVFRLLVLGEVVLAAGVLAITGVLAGLPAASSLALEGKLTEGVWEEQHGGTYSLMLHNTSLYEVVVEEARRR